MPGSHVERTVRRLLTRAGDAWTDGRWTAAVAYAEQALDLDPTNEDALTYRAAARRRTQRELGEVVRALDLLPVMSFITDSLNRIQWVNRRFATTVGDPIADQIPVAHRFVPAAIVGPYRDRFPRWEQEISACLPNLHLEVAAGNLHRGTLRLIERTLGSDDRLRAGDGDDRAWDGTMVVRDSLGRMALVNERVLSIREDGDRAAGFHVSLWFPVDGDQSADDRPRVIDRLTPRQFEIARLFASGMTAAEVATEAGVTPRTARDYAEEIYSRLEVHSRSELTLLMVRAGAI